MNTVQKPDLVRQEYKKYKRRKPPPDFSDVIDIRAPKLTGKSTDRIEKITFTSKKDWSVEACKVGLKNPEEWNVFLIKRSPGFMIISSPFFPDAQKYWCYKALTEYAMKPYPCNLDIHIEEGERENLWKATNKQVHSFLDCQLTHALFIITESRGNNNKLVYFCWIPSEYLSSF